LKLQIWHTQNTTVQLYIVCVDLCYYCTISYCSCHRYGATEVTRSCHRLHRSRCQGVISNPQVVAEKCHYNIKYIRLQGATEFISLHLVISSHLDEQEKQWLTCW